MNAESQPLLAVTDISLRFGGVKALADLTFEVQTGEICGLIGPNGAGKTTCFNVISRLLVPDSGEIIFQGQSLLKVPIHRIAGAGIGRTFQNLALFPSLSVLENVSTGAYSTGRIGLIRAATRLGVAKEEAEVRSGSLELLRRLGLYELANSSITGLPFGTLKRIEIARALASKPKLLLLDEPASGLTHSEVRELGEVIRSVRSEFSTSVLIVEHHMDLISTICDSVVAMNFGSVIATGTPEEVRKNEHVIDAYLGGSLTAAGSSDG